MPPTDQAAESAAKEAEQKAKEEAEKKQELEGSDVDNAAIKKHPVFVKVTEELAALRREREERLAAETKAQEERAKAERQKAIEDAEKAKDFEKAQALREAEHEAEKADYEEKLRNTQLKFELSLKGFSERGIKLLSTEYTEDKGPIEDYAKACLENEDNKVFLKTAPSREIPEAPLKVSVSGDPGMSIEKCKAYEKSADPEKRKQAREFLKAYRLEHGKYPY